MLLEGHGPDIAADRATLRSFGTFVDDDGWPELPPHRWSLAPGELRNLASTDPDGHDTGRFVAVIGAGLVFAERAQPPRALGPAVRVVSDRLKQNFDPTGRLNPGRDPAVR